MKLIESIEELQDAVALEKEIYIALFEIKNGKIIPNNKKHFIQVVENELDSMIKDHSLQKRIEAKQLYYINS